MNAIPDPDLPLIAKPRRWFTWWKICVFLLFLLGFLSYVAYAAKETYRVNAAHVGIDIISFQLEMFAARSKPEALTFDTGMRLLKEDRNDVADDGSGHYNLMQIGGRFVIYTEVMREGFALNRVVVFGSQERSSEAIPEAEFIARKKAGEL